MRVRGAPAAVVSEHYRRQYWLRSANLASTFAWVGSRFSGGALVAEDIEVRSSGDLAYTVGFERGLVSIDGAQPSLMTIRVTHLYRRIDGRCGLVHRHADFPPVDPRSATFRQ